MKKLVQLYMCNGKTEISKFIFYVYDDDSVALHYITTNGTVTVLKNVYVKKYGQTIDIHYGTNHVQKWLTDINGKLLPNWARIM